MLNMKLKPVRVVLKNETNEVTVCVDEARAGAFYTVVSIFSQKIRRDLVSLIAQTGLFSGNSDFLGSYTELDTMNLVFVHRAENLLEIRESIYATSFSKRKQITESLLVACAEAQISGSVGLLLLNPQNINIASDSSIYFNYFLDFHKWKQASPEEHFLRELGIMVSDILCRTYQERYGQPSHYPDELQVFYKKAQSGAFLTMSSILTAVKHMPDTLESPQLGVKRIPGLFKNIFRWFRRNATVLSILLIVAATIGFLTYQLVVRATAANTTSVYIGLDYIGEVYFGNRDE